MEVEITSQMATIIVAVLGAFATCFTFIMGKIHEKKIDLKKIKEEQYIDFLSALAMAKSNNCKDQDKLNEDLSIKVQTIYLVGSKAVQSSLKEFLKIFTNNENKNIDQSKAYGKLIQSMKIDLYGRKWKVTKKCFNSVDEINFTVFTSEKENINQS